MPVDYEKIGKLRRNLGKVLDKTLEDLTEVDKNLVHIINKDR